MPIMTPAQARIIDPIVTEHVRGYTNAAHVASVLFPSVNVKTLGGTIVRFDRRSMEAHNTRYTPGAEVPVVQVGYESGQYRLEEHALAGQLPKRTAEEAASAGIPIDTETGALAKDIVDLNLEIAAATAATTPANYATGHETTLSGSSQWSDYTNSNPITAISAARMLIHSKCLRFPNVLVLGVAVYEVLANHPRILERVVGVQSSGLRLTPSTEQLAAILRVERVVVAEAAQIPVAASASVLPSYIWGKHAVLAFSQQSPRSYRQPSFGFTYRLEGYPWVEQAWWDPRKLSWFSTYNDAWQPLIVGSDAGFLWRNAVA